MQHNLCLIKFSNPRPEDPPCPNEDICTFALLFVPSPSSFFPLSWASRLSLLFSFMLCSKPYSLPPPLDSPGKGLESKTKESLPGKL